MPLGLSFLIRLNNRKKRSLMCMHSHRRIKKDTQRSLSVQELLKEGSENSKNADSGAQLPGFTPQLCSATHWLCDLCKSIHCCGLASSSMGWRYKVPSLQSVCDD